MTREKKTSFKSKNNKKKNRRKGEMRTLLTLFQIGGEGVCQIVAGQEAGVWNVQTRVA